MISANNTPQFDEFKLRYLIQDHYNKEQKRQTLIKALNSFKTNFGKDNENNKRTFYVGEDTLKTNQCIAFFYVPNTQKNHRTKPHTAIYVQTSDNTPQGEIIGVYYADINIGKDEKDKYEIRCYYLKDRCCDNEVRELCGNVQMKLKIDGQGFEHGGTYNACLSITGEKDLDFLHDVNARLGEEKNNLWTRAYFVENPTYVRMFTKNDEKQKIEMKEFKTKFKIKYKKNGIDWGSVQHDGLTKGKEAQKPLSTIPIPKDNYQNPVMRDNNNGIKKEPVAKKIETEIPAEKIETEIRFVISKKKEQVIKLEDFKLKSKKKQKDNNSIQSNSEKKPNKNKNKEIKINDSSDSKRELDSSNIIKEEQDSSDIIKKPPIEQESSNNNNLIKINNDWEVEEKQDEKLKIALEEIEKLKKEIQQLKQTNKMNKGSLEAKEQHLKEAKNRNKELMNKITSKTQEMLEISDENEKFKKEKEKLKEEMTEAERKNEELTKKNESLNKQLKELESKLQQKYSSENQKLQKELQKTNTQLEQYLKRIKQLEKDQSTQYNIKVNSTIQKNQILEKQIEELNKKIQTYETDGMTLAMQQNKAKQEYNVQIIDLERKYETTIKNLNTDNEQLKEKNKKLKEQVKGQELELEKKLKEQESKLQQKYSDENQKLQKELADIKKQLTQKTPWQENLIPTQQPVAITYNGNTLEKTNLKKHTQTQFSFQSNHNINTKDNGEMVKLNERINQLTKTNEELNNEVKRQKTEMETTNNQNKEIKQINQVLQKENEKYKESLEKANNDNKLLAQQQQDINIQLKNQIAQQQQDINNNKTLKMKMTILESNQRIHENTIQVKDKMINNYKKNEELYNNKISALNEKLRNQQETQKEINRKNEELQEKIKQYEEQIEKLNCAINSTQQKINTSDETNQTLERKKGELEITNKKLQEEIAKLKEETEKLTNENLQLNTKLLIPTQQNNEAQHKPTISQENKNDIDIKIRQKLESLSRDELIEKAIDFLNIAQRNSTETQNLKERLEQLSRENEKQKENNALQQDNKKLLDTIKQKEEIIIYLQNDMKRQMKIHKESIQMLFKHYGDVYQKNQTNIETIKNLQQILNKQKEVNSQPIDDDKNNKTKNDNLPKPNSVITNANNELITPSQLGEMLKGQNQSNNKNQIEVTSNLQYNTENKKTKPQQQTKKLKENFKPKPQDESKNKEKPQIYQLCKGGPTYEIIPNNNAYNNNNINALHPQITKNQNNNTLEQEIIKNNFIDNYTPQIRDKREEGIYNQYIKPHPEQMLEKTNIIGSKEEQKNIAPTDNLYKQNNFISPSNPQNQIHKDNNNNYKSDINKNNISIKQQIRKNKNTTTKKYYQQQQNDMHLNLLLRQLEDNQKNAGELLMKTGNMFRKKAKKDDRDDIRRSYMRVVGQSSKWQQKIFLEEKQKKKMEKMYMRTGKQSSNKPIKGNHNIIVPKYY